MILFTFIAGLVVLACCALILASSKNIGRDLEASLAGSGALSATIIFIIGIFVVLGGMGSTMNHIDNLGKVRAQEQIIVEYETRIDRLESRLDQFNFPEKSTVSLDSDSPWASIIKSLDNAESQLTEARVERAQAQRTIESRKAGPFWFVVWFYGDE